MIGWAIQQGKVAAHRSAEIATTNITKLLVDNINGTIEKNDLGIRSVLDEIYRQQKTGRENEEALQGVIKKIEGRLPDLFGFRIFGPDGKLRYAVSNIANPKSDLSKRADFIALRENLEDGLVISEPVFGATTQQWAIALARRINNPDGSFGGAVYGPIPIKALTKFFGALQLGPGGTIALYHSSYKMAARFPEITGVNSPIGTMRISDQLRTIIASGCAVRPIRGSFDQRLSLPDAWAGLRDEAFAAAVGLPDATFCHPARFVCGARSRESAIALARMAVGSLSD